MGIKTRLQDLGYRYQAILLAPPRRVNIMNYVVYAIVSETNSRLYIGFTGNINTRLQYHNSGYVKSTAKDRPWRLVALEEHRSISDARWAERSLKKSKGKRLRWIEKNRLHRYTKLRPGGRVLKEILKETVLSS